MEENIGNMNINAKPFSYSEKKLSHLEHSVEMEILSLKIKFSIMNDIKSCFIIIQCSQ